MASIRRFPNGNYQVQIRLKGLPAVTKTFKTKRNALAFIRQVESDTELIRALGKCNSRIPNFRSLCDLYMNQYTGSDPSTTGRLNFWCEFFGDMPVNNIDEFLVDDGLHVLSRRGLTGSTINRYKSTLSAAFIFFIQHPKYKKLGYLNPVRKESVSRFKENPQKDRFLSMDEQKSLLKACRGVRWTKLYLLVLLALTTGARKGELLSLRWCDINFKERVALLNGNNTKNSKPRYLPLTKPIIEELMNHRDVGDHLIFNNSASHYRPFDHRKSWKRALNLASIVNCRFHDLRHTAASNLVRNGRTLFEVGVLLGHSNADMTKRYSHLATKDTIDMVDSVMGDLK